MLALSGIIRSLVNSNSKILAGKECVCNAKP
jgi:hypothetical protein